MTIAFKKAARHAVKLKLAIDGPSGSGKTLGALALAKGITHGGRIALADSENGSASLYADRFEFDTCILDDSDPKTVIEVIDFAVANGYDALVIDSLSHVWQAVLDAKDEHERANPRSNGYMNWKTFGARWEKLVKHMLDAPIHIIATMRSKQAYEQITESDGKKKVVKLGLQPQVRDGAEYEFSIVFSVNIAHRAEATKDRTGLYAGELLDLCDEKLHAGLRRWMNEGGPTPEPVVAPVTKPAEELTVHGKPMTELTDDELTRYIAARSGESRNVARVTRARQILDERAANRSPDETMARVHAAVAAEDAELPFK